ncbi:hypothetical protein AAHH78_43705, partial [Burkholderia pseudomallei]
GGCILLVLVAGMVFGSRLYDLWSDVVAYVLCYLVLYLSGSIDLFFVVVIERIIRVKLFFVDSFLGLLQTLLPYVV